EVVAPELRVGSDPARGVVPLEEVELRRRGHGVHHRLHLLPDLGLEALDDGGDLRLGLEEAREAARRALEDVERLELRLAGALHELARDLERLLRGVARVERDEDVLPGREGLLLGLDAEDRPRRRADEAARRRAVGRLAAA